jgi:predicted phosphoribosyltransferase
MAKVRILSRSPEPFHSRVQAGQLLSQQMSGLKGKKAVVLGIPRGGIVVAQGLAHGIEADIDIVLSRKLGAPGHSELAIGALAETGDLFLNRPLVEDLSVSDEYIKVEKQRQMEEIQRRNQLVRKVLPHISLHGRIAIITDDGVATGATMQAAVWAIKHEKPQSLIAAVPVASEEAVSRLANDVDEVVCLRMPDNFMAVGQFYREFEQITDEEVIQILRQEQERKKSGSGLPR